VEPSSAPWRIVEPEPDGASSPGAAPPGRDLPWVPIGAILIALVVAVSGLLLAARPEAGVEIDGAVDVDAGSVAQGGPGAAGPAATAEDVVVEVGGAVVRPGVYRLPPGSRVQDAITAAGGFGPRVDAAEADRGLNLAAPVRDGDEIHVPARGEVALASPGAAGDGAGGGSGGGSGPVDMNHATAEQLDTLPGVGPATAAKIIAAREEQPFASIDELGVRKVVGPATLEKIRPLVTVGP
jgi:competence protein ComEA